MNKQRLLSIIMVSILAVVAALFCSCGIDTSTIAGSASQINHDSESVEEDPEYDNSTEDLDTFAEDEEVTEDLDEEEQPEIDVEYADEEMVWIPSTGNCYHNKSSCSNMKDPRKVPISEALQDDKRPCKKCYGK